MKFLFVLLIPIFGFSQTTLTTKYSLVDGKIEFMAPKGLSKMTDAVWALKYRTLPKPLMALTDEAAEVNLLADLTQQPAAESQIPAYKDMRIANLKKRADITIFKEGMKEVNGKKIGFIKFSSQAVDQKIFNYYFFTIVNGKVFLFTFNCIESKQKEWEKIADDILASVKVK